MTLIKILLADDHTIVRTGIRALLEAEADMEVIGEAQNGREAVQKATELQPEVVLMDITMPILNGLEATCQIKKLFPQMQVIILTMHANEEYVLQILRAGATGYLIKQTELSELMSAIRLVHRGEVFLSPSISRTVIAEYIRQAEAVQEEDSYDTLTEREKEVLQLVAEGFQNRNIAQELHLSTKTVETHKTHLLDKLNAQSVADLVKYAIRKGVIRLDE